MKKHILCKLLAVVILFAFSCRKEQYRAPAISGVTGDAIVMNIGDKMILAPTITNLKGNTYSWLVNGTQVATGEISYTFAATEPGNFDVTFKVDNKGGTDQQIFKIVVEKTIAVSIAEGITVPKCSVMEIAPAVTGPERNDYDYEWTIGDSVIGKELNLNFIAADAGTYALTLRASAGKQTSKFTRNVTVTEASYLKNANTLVEYLPSPGKNHNWSIIGYAENWQYGGENPLPYNEFLSKASELRKQVGGNNSLFLGGWGGSATFKFDHTVVNVPGKPDMEIAATHSNNDLPAIYVAWDKNKNGQPDADEWFEIKNADYGIEDLPEYQMTFTYDRTETDTRRFYSYFKWKDNQEEPLQGEIVTNKTFTSSKTTSGAFSTRGFFPGLNVINADTKATAMLEGWPSTFTRKGKRITKDLSGSVQFYQTRNIDIDLAVNEKGEPVQLPGIDFIKVQKVIYPFLKDFNDGNKYKDFNMEESRMLQVNTILDKHLKN
ncbi:MAG: PKD-like domain-containing protein [Pseudobacter sp.]|uniref:PKD-like domain-containing protein n=1 Tax=Pseudobacter sp. TaxID=2045420 RepID=UPI003F8236C0